MALSRFWSWMIVISVAFIFYMLGTGRLYSLNGMVNGKQNDAVLVQEHTLESFAQDTAMLALLSQTKGVGFSAADGKSYKLLENNIVEVSEGKQAADGIFPTCKNTIMDI